MSTTVRHNVSVDRFALAMKAELDVNRHKGGWDDCPIGYLRTRLHQEVRELVNSLESGDAPEKVLSECADVANFVMMISEVYAATGGGLPGKGGT